MTVDLWILVYSTLFCLTIPVVGVIGVSRVPGGTVWGFGNRDTPLPVPTWIERVRRAHMNMVENLAPFAALVLIAYLTGKSDATTALGAQIFFVARVAHAGVYIVGIPYLRTAVFAVSIAGMLMIVSRIMA